jgi:SAM-dependent methyltransferase
MELAHRIRNGDEVSDYLFDRLYPGRMRLISSLHWTPIEIAKRAAALATSDGQKRVLDVGSGVGKFCTIGALTTNATFVGVEQREHLVTTARDVASRLRLSTVEYLHKNAVDIDWANFDSIYLFNPFAENLDDSIRIDESTDLSTELYIKYVRYTERQLTGARPGTKFIVYNRFGGVLPDDFECVLKDEVGSLPLEVWRKK